jgi:hypothetical protein
MRTGGIAVFFLILCPLLFTQQLMNNDSVVKLARAGVSDDLIVSTINTQPGAYDASVDAIIALKKAGVSVLTEGVQPAAVKCR